MTNGGENFHDFIKGWIFLQFHFHWSFIWSDNRDYVNFYFFVKKLKNENRGKYVKKFEIQYVEKNELSQVENVTETCHFEENLWKIYEIRFS